MDFQDSQGCLVLQDSQGSRDQWVPQDLPDHQVPQAHPAPQAKRGRWVQVSKGLKVTRVSRVSAALQGFLARHR